MVKNIQGNIYVCIKQVPDSAASIKVVGDNAIDQAVTWLLNPYDENAVAAACEMKKHYPDAEVVALTLGSPLAEGVLRSAMAMGADRGIHLLSENHFDHLQIASILAAAIDKDGSVAMIFTGKEAIDSGGGVLPFYLGSKMGLPVASNVTSLIKSEIGEGSDTLEIQNDLGTGDAQVLQMTIPCVIGAGKTLCTPIYPTLPDVIKAKKKPIKTVQEMDFHDHLNPVLIERVALRPSIQVRKNEVIQGPPETAVVTLLDRLKNKAKVI